MEFGHLEGVPQPYLGDLLTMVTNYLLTGMILQVIAPVTLGMVFIHKPKDAFGLPKWRFIGIPYKKLNNPGGDCYWVGGSSKEYLYWSKQYSGMSPVGFERLSFFSAKPSGRC